MAWANLAGALAWQFAWLAGLVAGASPTAAGIHLLALGGAGVVLALAPSDLAGRRLRAAERSRSRGGLVPALGSYAVGVVGALALALATALGEAALTVAVAALLPATAWVGRRLGLEALRGPA